MAKKGTSGSRKGFESKYDEKKLRTLIQEGKGANHIRETLGIATMQSLRQHVMRLCNTDRTFYDVPGLYVRNQRMPQINFKNQLTLSPKMMDFEGSTYKHGDKFEIQIDNDKIILTRLGEPVETKESEVEMDVEAEVETEADPEEE